MLRMARDNLDNLLKVEEFTTRAVAEGGRPRVELNRIRLDVLAGRQAARNMETVAVATKAALKAVTGGLNVGEREVPSEVPPPIPITALEIARAFELARGTRPDLQALRWQVAKAQADLDVEYRKGKPEVTPKIGYTRQFQEKAIGFPDADSWGIGVDMTLPLYNRNQGNRLKSFAAANQRAFAVQAAEIELRSELETVTQELQAAEQSTGSVVAEQLRLAAQVRDGIAASYEAGGRPLIDLLDAQRNYRETYRLYIAARVSFWRAFYKYNAAIGQQVLTHDPRQFPPGLTE